MADQASTQISQQMQQPIQLSEPSTNNTGTGATNNTTTNVNALPVAIRLLMLGKEVGGIIGKKGDNIKRFREESGAKINISDGSSPERIVTLAGSVQEVFKAFSLICRKFEEGYLSTSQGGSGGASGGAGAHSPTGGASMDVLGVSSAIDQSLFGSSLLGSSLKDKEADAMMALNNNNNSNNNNNNTSTINNNNTTNSADIVKPNTGLLITIRFIIPASHCGSFIGIGGKNIKEIRELTGATIQVAADVLPNSTERVVTISGNVDSLTRCAYQICDMMARSPTKAFTILYRPKPVDQILLAAATAAGHQLPAAWARPGLPAYTALAPHPDINRLFISASNPLAAFSPAVSLRTAAANAAVAASNQATAAISAIGPQTITSSHEMQIPNGLIGCVIGKGGSRINEIRHLSGATIKISNSEDGTKNRTVTINGTPEAINIAQYLITTSISTAVLANG